MRRRTRKALERLLDGEISQEETLRIEKTLAGDQESKREMQFQKEMVAALKSLPVAEPSRDIAASVDATLTTQPAPLAVKGFPKTGIRLAWIAASAIAGAAAAIGATLVFSTSQNQQDPSLLPKDVPTVLSICRVRDVRGEVFKVDQAQETALQVGQRLFPGELLEAKARSRVEVDIDNDARLILHPESTLRIGELKETVRNLILVRGRASVDLLNGGKRAVLLHGPDSAWTGEGRTGSFSALALDGGRSALGVVRGSVQLTSGSVSTAILAGQQAKRRPNQTGVEIEPLPSVVDLVLSDPEQGVWRVPMVSIAGRSNGFSRVWVRGVQIPTTEQGGFSTKVEVKPGDRILILAEDVVGNSQTIEMGPLMTPTQARIPGNVPDKKVEAKSYKVNW